MNLTQDQRFDILKVEMTLIQRVLDKYDDMIFKSRNWFITLWTAAIGLGFTVRVPALILMASFLAVLYWILEGIIRHQYWYKYVIRYRAIRSELNEPAVDGAGLSLYDLTHHYGVKRTSEWERIWRSFGKLEPFVLYLALGLAAVLVWRLVLTGIIPMPPIVRGGS